MRTVTFNGRKVLVYRTKVKIYDVDDSLDDREAFTIVKYLYDEGFIDADNITCEIIHDERD